MTTKYVPFPVPEDRVPDVAVFLYGPSAAMPHEPEAQEASAEQEVQISDEQRNELLTRIYVESEPPFRALLLLLADRDDPAAPMFYGDILSAHPDWSASRSVAGAMGAFGRRTVHRYGGYWPFERDWNHEQWSHFLRMDADVAEFLIDLHADRQMPLIRD